MKRGAAGKWKHTTLMAAQKLEIIRKLESGEGQREVMTSYKVELSMIFNIIDLVLVLTDSNNNGSCVGYERYF